MSGVWALARKTRGAYSGELAPTPYLALGEGMGLLGPAFI